MSTPTKPVDIRPGTPQNNDSSSISGSPSIRALRAQYGTPPVPNIPPRNVPVRTPSINIGNQGSGSPRPSAAGTPIIGGIRMQAPGGPGSGTRTPASGYENPFEELTDEEKARILRRHLVSREQREHQLDRKSSFGSFTDRGEGPSKSKGQSTNAGRDPVLTREDSEAFPIPYHTPGADLTHNIYKWQSDQRRTAVRPRAASFSGSTHSNVNPVFANIHEPGGFRRNYLLMRAHEQGEEQPEMVSSFIEFLYLFGHFVNTFSPVFLCVLSNEWLLRPAKIWRKSKKKTRKLWSRMRRGAYTGPSLRQRRGSRRLFTLCLI
jgi:proton-coupled amino acid transporter